MTNTSTTTPATQTVALTIGGMTCASCAARIGKRLNKINGVEAGVNYATEQATITFTEDTSVDELIRDGLILTAAPEPTLPEPALPGPTQPDRPARQVLAHEQEVKRDAT